MHRFQRPAYIADGFEDDCDELIHRCSQVKTLSYEKFCQIWKDMDFVTIFHGRNASSELAELSEEVIHIAKKYMVSTTSNFEESVAGLFLVYALVNLQPLHGFAALRLVPDDVPSVRRIERLARQSRRYDVLYILGSLLIKGPSQCHVMQRERGMERPLKKYFDSYVPADDKGIRPKGVFYRQTEESDLLKELDRLGTLYKDAKKALVGPSTTEKSLNYVSDSLMKELDSSLKKVVLGVYDGDSSDCDDLVRTSQPRENPQSIKERAMRSTVKGLRHLKAIDDDSAILKPPVTRVHDPNSAKIAMTRQIATMFAVKATSDEQKDIYEEYSLPDLDNEPGPSGIQDNTEKKQKINNAKRAQSKLARNAQKRKAQKGNPKNKRRRKKTGNSTDETTDDDSLNDSLESNDNDQETNDKQETNDNEMIEPNSVEVVVDDGAPTMEIEFIDLGKKPKGKLVKKLRNKLSRREQKKTRIKGTFQRMGMSSIANFDSKIDAKDNLQEN